MTLDKINAEERVTAIVRVRVDPDKEDMYRALSQKITEACADFDGYLGTKAIAPTQSGQDHVTLFSFDTYHNFCQWENSKERDSFLSQLTPLVVGAISREQTSGLDYWFRSESTKNSSWPPSLKMTFVAFLAIFPLSYGVPRILAPLLPSNEMLAETLTIASITVLMSYVSLPLMVRLFARTHD